MQSKAVSNTISEVLLELSTLPSLSNFSLGGGTNLALRYNHRISEDIDLFCPGIIGKNGFKKILDELDDIYKGKIKGIYLTETDDDQFIFLRVFIFKKNDSVKLEFIQNTKNLLDIEIHNGIRLLSELDIGVMKLLALSTRQAKKDLYDLSYITDRIELIDLYRALENKEKKYNLPIHRTIFDLNKSVSPTQNLNTLLFDNVRKYSFDDFKPGHSTDVLKLIEGSSNFISTKFNWKIRVKKLYEQLGQEFPKRSRGRRL